MSRRILVPCAMVLTLGGLSHSEAAPGFYTFPAGGLLKWAAVSDTSPCAGGLVLVVVGAQNPNTPAAPVEVHVDGAPGTPQIVQYFVPRPDQKIHLYAVSRGLEDQEEVAIQVGECPGTGATLQMLYNQNPFHKNRVDFHARLGGRPRGRAYVWVFGDGTTATTTVPFVSHDYSPSMQAAEKYTYFSAFVAETSSQLVSGKRIALGSSFHRSRMMGFVQADVDATITKTGFGFVVGLDVRNHHKSPIVLNRYFKQYLPCDVRPGRTGGPQPARFEDVTAEQVLGTGVAVSHPAGVLAPGRVTIAAGQRTRSRLVLPLEEIPLDTCVIGFNLMGESAGRQKVYGSYYLQVRRNPHFTQALTDGQTLAALKSLAEASLLPDTDVVSAEDLHTLEQRGLVERTAFGWKRVQ